MNGNLPKPAARLKEVLQGISIELYKALEAKKLIFLIGEYADEINKAGYGHLFGRLQGVLTDIFIISLMKVFEKEKGYSLESIPAAIKILRNHPNELAPLDREVYIDTLKGLGLIDPNLPSVSNKEFNLRIAEFFEVALEANKNKLIPLKELRDKRIAHREYTVEEPNGSTWGEALDCWNIAVKILGIIGGCYFRTMYIDKKGIFVLDYDASHSTIQLKKLLRKVGIIPEKQVVGNGDSRST